jgi:hypothetical protein
MSTINVNRMVDSQGGVLAPISSVMRNRIINGDMRIDQRNAGASVNPTSGQYTLDRWLHGVSAASKFSVQRNAGSVTPPLGFTNYLGVTSLSAYSVSSGDFFSHTQIIEGFNVADLAWGTANAQPVTVSFWVRSSLTGTFGGSISNGGYTRTYPFSYVVSSANTWEYKTVTIAGDTTGTWATDNSSGLILKFGLGAGSTYTGTAGAWAGANLVQPTGTVSVVGTNGATFYITGVQLEKGTQATSFEYRQYGQELALCQRYYYRTPNNSSFVLGASSYNSFQFKVSMRAAPTVTVTPTSGVISDINVNTEGLYCTSTALTSCSVIASIEL